MSNIEIGFAIISGLLTVICTILWFDFREVRSDARRAREDLAAYKEHVAREFSSKEDLQEMRADLDRKLDALFNELRSFREKVETLAIRIAAAPHAGG